MCGIFGEFGNELLKKQSFLKINELSKNRGPDMNGYSTDKSTWQLGFNRLSILDLSDKGNQPMISNDGRWIMVMNGEIYNYRALKSKLNLLESKYQSKTDSEVLLTSFEKFGIEKSLKEINGIFAISLIDKENKLLYLIRDYAGVKPLYYAFIRNKIVFASQYDQIFNHPDFNKCHNNKNLYDFVRFGYISAPNAFFKNSYQVQPGEIISVNLSMQVSKRKFYEFININQDFNESDLETLELLDEKLQSSVKSQLMSDVPVGSFLSGGIDSPIITYYANKINKQLESFTIGSMNNNLDESSQAKKYADLLRIKNHIHYHTNRTLLHDIDEQFKAYSEPFGDYSSLPTFRVCKIAKKYFKVILGGDGGDEIFWGYPRFKKYVSHYPWFNYGKLFRKVGGYMGRRIGIDVSYGINLECMGDWIMENQSHNEVNEMKKLIPDSTNSNHIKKLYSLPSTINNKSQLLNWLRWNEFYGHLQRVLLKVDRASMYHGIEVRVPFLDRNILDFALKINPELDIRHKKSKYLLKKIMEKAYCKSFIEKNKMGFSIDINSSLKTILKDELFGLLLDQDPYPNNTFDRKYLEKYLLNYMKGKRVSAWGVWILFSLQKWAHTFNIK